MACIHGGVQGVVSHQMLERGILVTNWYDSTAVALGSWAMSLLLAIMSDFRAQVHLVKSGGWRYEPDQWLHDAPHCDLDRVYGRTVEGLKVGVLGLGHAGRKFAQYA